MDLVGGTASPAGTGVAQSGSGTPRAMVPGAHGADPRAVRPVSEAGGKLTRGRTPRRPGARPGRAGRHLGRPDRRVAEGRRQRLGVPLSERSGDCPKCRPPGRRVADARPGAIGVSHRSQHGRSRGPGFRGPPAPSGGCRSAGRGAGGRRCHTRRYPQPGLRVGPSARLAGVAGTLQRGSRPALLPVCRPARWHGRGQDRSAARKRLSG